MARFDDKVAWITGGGTGLGLALALELARQGAKVALSGRREDVLAAAVETLRAAGAEALAIPCDVTKEEDLERAVQQVVSAFGRLDVAVANAGFSLGGRVESLHAEDWRRQLDVNVVGAAMTAAKALPELRKTRGRLGVVSSVTGMLPYPSGAPYAASKSAVATIGLILSMELYGSGVSCTTIYPGFVESEIGRVDNRGVFHPEREDHRPARLLWPADKAARSMASALYRRKREHVFTAHGKVGAWFGRHAPGLVSFTLERFGQGAAKHTAAGSKDAGEQERR